MSFGRDVNGSFTSVGIGSTSCGKFTSTVDQGNNTQKWTELLIYKNYAGGFITGINLSLDNTYDIRGGTDAQGIMAFIEKHCRENPLDQFGNALDSLIYELYPNRTITEP